MTCKTETMPCLQFGYDQFLPDLYLEFIALLENPYVGNGAGSEENRTLTVWPYVVILMHIIASYQKAHVNFYRNCIVNLLLLPVVHRSPLILLLILLYKVSDLVCHTNHPSSLARLLAIMFFLQFLLFYMLSTTI